MMQTWSRPFLSAVTAIAVTFLLGSNTSAEAQSEGRLTVAIYAGVQSAFWRDNVVERFSDRTGISAEVFESPFPASSIAQAQGRPQFDVSIMAPYSVPGLVERDLLETIDPASIPNLSKVPEEYWVRTPDGDLVGVPIYFAYLGVAYNNTYANSDDFASWNDLLDPKWKDLVSMSRPAILAVYDVTLYSKVRGGDEYNIEPGLEFLQSYAENVLGIYTSMSSFEAQLARGEVVAAPFYSNQVYLIRRAGATQIDMTIPEEGALMLSYILAIPKGAENVTEALELMDSILSPEYQVMFSEGTGVWPINPETELPAELQEELGMTIEEAFSRNYAPDWYFVGSQHEERTRIIETMIQAGQ